jgi:FMN phosphatase YigB (HAD superfamily)
LLDVGVLDPRFDRLFNDASVQTLSADVVRRLNPAPEPYRMATERQGVPIQEIRLVAAHAWDIAGTLNAGCAAAFVARPGQVLDPLGARPDIVGSDLHEVAERILALDQLEHRRLREAPTSVHRRRKRACLEKPA